jgi:cytochrome c oxidase subunit 2
MLSPRLSGCLIGLVFASFILGCGKTEPTPDNTTPGPGGPGFAKSGNDVFDQHCAKCHSFGEPPPGGSKGKRGGPSLSKVGADPAHSADWIAAYIKDPHAQKPGSKMPKFEGKLDAEQIKSVAEFLAAKK